MIALGRDWLVAHLPHQGAMNLLDEIVSWDAQSIRGLAHRHRDADHPLRRDGELPIVAGIEYGAQLAAAHGALAAGLSAGSEIPPGMTRGGYLVSVRSISFHARRLDDVHGALQVYAEQLGGGEAGVLYRFEVRSEERCLVEGRVAVAFMP